MPVNNPIEILKLNAYSQLDIHLSIGTEDTLGFNEGVQVFESTANSLKGRTTASYVSGPHCVFDTQQVGTFLSGHLSR